jgi:hypothetical protein
MTNSDTPPPSDGPPAEEWGQEQVLQVLISATAVSASSITRSIASEGTPSTTVLLRQAHDLVLQADELMALAIARARHQGTSWGAIGMQTGGGTASAAQQRHTKRLLWAQEAVTSSPLVSYDELPATLAWLDSWVAAAPRGFGKYILPSSTLPPLTTTTEDSTP